MTPRIHFEAPHGVSLSACGRLGEHADITSHPPRVTCKLCLAKFRWTAKEIRDASRRGKRLKQELGW